MMASITMLTRDILKEVILFLSASDFVRFSRANKYLSIFAKDNSTWKRFFARDFPSVANDLKLFSSCKYAYNITFQKGRLKSFKSERAILKEGDFVRVESSEIGKVIKFREYEGTSHISINEKV